MSIKCIFCGGYAGVSVGVPYTTSETYFGNCIDCDSIMTVTVTVTGQTSNKMANFFRAMSEALEKENE